MPQGRVAELVAEPIVDLLEMVQVAHQGGGRAIRRGRQGERACAPCRTRDD